MEQPLTPTPETPAPQPANGLLSFIQSLKNSKGPEVQPKHGDITKPIDEKGPLFHHLSEFSWSIQQNQWIKISLVAHIAFALLVWGGVYMAFTRPIYMQVGAPSLEEAAKAFYQTDYQKIDPSLTWDQEKYFVTTTLQYLYQFNPHSNTPLDLLVGMVKPDIIDKIKNRDNHDRRTIEKMQIYQNLSVTMVHQPIPNPETGTLAIFVNGFISQALQDSNGNPVNRIQPYRAKLILRGTPVSEINPFPLTLEELDEVHGEAAVKKWDADTERFFK